ncbi:hypothetical protein PMIN01_11853 [Paraphaeosphaeria minitans]|uniref:Uncharacterized protein n=1 Tax=Paraphaeosphaeria minitans TaxID=565426 RepID=A0A9P6G8U1_9PLEO|nr:hypothetical protein PMIN01_11853 [Paraphaeosphaeria minitans]
MATFKRKTVLSAWEQSGIFPYNPEIVYMKLPTPIRTPSPDLSPVDSSPIANTPTSNISSRRLRKFLQSSQLLIDSLALAQRDLSEITAAAQQRQKRQVKDIRQVQRGGIVTVQSARRAIDQRVEVEAQKVARKAALAGRAKSAQEGHISQRNDCRSSSTCYTKSSIYQPI